MRSTPRKYRARAGRSWLWSPESPGRDNNLTLALRYCVQSHGVSNIIGISSDLYPSSSARLHVHLTLGGRLLRVFRLQTSDDLANSGSSNLDEVHGTSIDLILAAAQRLRAGRRSRRARRRRSFPSIYGTMLLQAILLP